MMIIQINTGNNLDVHKTYQADLKDLLSEELSRFDKHIIPQEVHLYRENSNKKSEDDKRCIIEARLKGRQAIVVTNIANTYSKLYLAPLINLETSLDTILGRLRNQKMNDAGSILIR